MPKTATTVVADPGVRYGIYNTVKKSFQFHICEDTPEKAVQALLAKIGTDARLRRFQARPIPNYKPYPHVSTQVYLDPANLALLNDMADVVCKGQPNGKSCVGQDICPYKLPQPKMHFVLSDKLVVRLTQPSPCPPTLRATIVDATNGRNLRTTGWNHVSDNHYSVVHDRVIYDIFFVPKEE